MGLTSVVIILPVHTYLGLSKYITNRTMICSFVLLETLISKNIAHSAKKKESL